MTAHYILQPSDEGHKLETQGLILYLPAVASMVYTPYLQCIYTEQKALAGFTVEISGLLYRDAGNAYSIALKKLGEYSGNLLHTRLRQLFNTYTEDTGTVYYYHLIRIRLLGLGDL